MTGTLCRAAERCYARVDLAHGGLLNTMSAIVSQTIVFLRSPHSAVRRWLNGVPPCWVCHHRVKEWVDHFKNCGHALLLACSEERRLSNRSHLKPKT